MALQLPFDLHPESAASLDRLLKAGLFEKLASAEISIETVRKYLEEFWRSDRTAVEYDGRTEEFFVPSEEVKGGIPVYVYRPRSAPPDPTILIYYHGGGNIAGFREQVEDTCKILSSQGECIVVNVEYRLAPEHKFPAMVNDAVAVARWVLADPTLVGGTPKSKVGVSGDSAGGLLTASVSNEVPGLAFQIPVYGLFSGATHDSASFRQLAGSVLGQTEFLYWMESLLADKKEDLDSPRYHVLANEKYDHLPPTLLIVAEIDQLRDDSYEYAKRLTAAGVRCELFLAKGAIHGYFTFPGTSPELTGESYAKVVEFIKTFKPKQSP